MSKNITLEAKQGEQHDHKAMQFLMQYVVTLGICIGGLVILVVLSKLVLSTRIWYQTDPYWPMLHWLNLHVISVCVAASGAICLIVTIYYLFRAFRQIKIRLCWFYRCAAGRKVSASARTAFTVVAFSAGGAK